MIKLLLKYFPTYIELAKIGNKTYYRLTNSTRPWKILDRKYRIPKKRKKNAKQPVQYLIPEDSLMERNVVLTGIDKKTSERRAYQMVIEQLEQKSRKQLHEMWWEVKSIRRPSRWKITWISLSHKDISYDEK